MPRLPQTIFRLTGVLLFVFYLLIGTAQTKVRAQEAEGSNFETVLESTYSVDTQGDTYVEHLFKIKNLSPTVFINKYSLTLGSGEISQIKAVKQNKELEFELNQTNSATQISLTFAEETVGKDKVNQFSISYHNPDLANIKGKVLELNLPAMANAQKYQKHSTKLITPLEYGYPNRITPEYDQIKIEDQTTQITYERLGGQGISAIFGTEQIYQLALKYHLSNPNNQPGLTQISLPPDTPYQKLLYQLLEPRPQKMEADEDGNWIATYLVPATQAIEIQAQALVKVTVEPLDNSLQISPQPFHLAAQAYWPIKSSEIQAISQEIDQAEEIYNYTIDQLNYHQGTAEELADLKRLGALGALKQPELAVCQEFSDLFITLARANQIPAKQATGYAYSENERLRPLSFAGDVLHAWPEYYNQDQQAWVPVDPTWGDTTQGVDYFNQFDLNHIVFAYNGKDSQRPFPAGAYKEKNRQTRDIEVSFVQDFPVLEPDLSFKLNPTRLGPVSIPGLYQLEISNQTGAAWYDNQLKIKSTQNTNNLAVEVNQTKFDLLPFETRVIKLKLYNNQEWLYTQQPVKISITTRDQKQLNYEQSVKTLGQIGQVPTQQAAVYGLGALFLILAIATGSLLVFRRRQ